MELLENLLSWGALMGVPTAGAEGVNKFGLLPQGMVIKGAFMASVQCID